LKAAIRGIEYYLPDGILTNEEIAAEHPDWTIEKIESKTGIRMRHIASPGQCSSDLGVEAANKLFASGACAPHDVDYILFCTQSPDYFLPSTACIVQDRLGVPTSAGALDFNLGCSGFVSGLGIAKGLIETGQSANVLLITSETYSKFIHPADRSVRSIFGDAAAACLVSKSTDKATVEAIGPFVYGTDGSGAENLMVARGGMRSPGCVPSTEQGGNPSDANLYMNGAEIFNFTLKVVPLMVDDLLEKSSIGLDDVDLFIFHQANGFMLEHLRKKLKLQEERFFTYFAETGNTVSSTIPIALKEAIRAGKVHNGDRIMLVGFGVGYSWTGAMIRWTE
jgi:3-oxoacyl-[acyl-carrier-protein] synthase-3